MLIAKCPRQYFNKDVIRKCEKSLFPSDEEDFSIRIPASSRDSSVHYANRYCAACHNDSSAEWWDVNIACECSLSAFRENKSDDEIRSTLHYDATVGQYFVTENNRSKPCNFHSFLPANAKFSSCLSTFVQECPASSEKPSDCKQIAGDAVCAQPTYVFANAECARCNYPQVKLEPCDVSDGTIRPKLSLVLTRKKTGKGNPTKTLFKLRRSSNKDSTCSIPAVAKHYCDKYL